MLHVRLPGNISLSIVNIMYSISGVQVISGVKIILSMRCLVFSISVSGSIQIIYMISGIDHIKYFALITTIKIR